MYGRVKMKSMRQYAASTEIDLNTKFSSGDTKLKETKRGIFVPSGWKHYARDRKFLRRILFSEEKMFLRKKMYNSIQAVNLMYLPLEILQIS